MVRANEFGQPVGEPVTWSGARAPEPVELSGRLVRLVPFADRYVAPLHALREHRELWTYLADDLSDVTAVVPAGGVGTRLWPLSRAAAPKFLHDLTGAGRSLLQTTVDRLEPLVDDRVMVVTGARHADAVREQLPRVRAACLRA